MTGAAEDICFATRADKRRDFPGRVIPAMRRAIKNALRGDEGARLDGWIRDHVYPSHAGVPFLSAVHHAAQREGYRSNDPIECDTVYVEYPITTVLDEGGDCDQWAVLIAAALKRAGFKPVLFGFGSRASTPNGDPWEHVAVGTKHAGVWVLLDAKGNAAGLPFNVWPGEPTAEAKL